jgi:hypothetical protein
MESISTKSANENVSNDLIMKTANCDHIVDEDTPLSPKGSISTSADTAQAGICFMQLQNKVLSGQCKKLEAAMLRLQLPIPP